MLPLDLLTCLMLCMRVQAAQAAAAEEEAAMFKHKTVTTVVEDDDVADEAHYKEFFPDHHGAFEDLAAMLEDPDAADLPGDTASGKPIYTPRIIFSMQRLFRYLSCIATQHCSLLCLLYAAY